MNPLYEVFSGSSSKLYPVCFLALFTEDQTVLNRYRITVCPGFKIWNNIKEGQKAIFLAKDLRRRYRHFQKSN